MRGAVDDQRGRVIGGRYRVLATLGTGASARVYLGHDVRLDRPVALKVLLPTLADDQVFLKRFRAEAQFVAKLAHPNIVQVYDWGEDDGDVYLVLEYLAGGSLRSMLDRGRLLSPSQALLVGLEAARGLDYAHRQGLVHRDIKPANLLFDAEGRLRIADFGIARAVAEATWTEPAGVVLGTARYASPEQARSLPVDGKSDVYSLALVLVEAVTGKVPFAADTTVATLMARIDRLLPVSAELGPLAPVLERAGRPDVDDRYDAAELARALVVTAERLPAPQPLPLVRLEPDLGDDTLDLSAMVAAAVEPPRFAPAEPPVRAPSSAGSGPARAAAPPAGHAPRAPAAEAPAPRPFPEVPPRKRRWPWALLAVLLLGAGGGFAFWWFGVRDTTVRYTLGNLVNLQVGAAENVVTDLDITIVTIPTRQEGTEPGQVVAQDPPPGTIVQGQTLTLTVSEGPPLVPVPDLTGLLQDQAQARLAEAKLTPGTITPVADEDVPLGIVLDWKPRDMTVPQGETVDLVVSGGPALRTIPDTLVGAAVEQATAELAALRLVVTTEERFSDSVGRGKVISVEPAAGQQVARDSSVKLVVSKGPDLVTVPDVKGLTLAQANTRLEQAGLTPGEVSGNARRPVASTDPAAGTSVRRGSRVDLRLG